ncbi:MAG TPA: metallophosphoesterase [Blastocatellia bacterium]|nr:metallophosphoesterase [Blastocatellia bacterium]
MVGWFGFIRSALPVAALRLGFSLVLVAVQLYVLRAAIRIIRSHEFAKPKERALIAAAVVVLLALNVPLFFFIVESVVRPQQAMLYSPPSAYEPWMRPFAYVFFVWTMGSIAFTLAAPVTMAAFAAVQYFRRQWSGSAEGATLQALDLSRRRFLRMALTAVASMPFAASAYGAVAARFSKTIERVVVPVPGLPPQLDGLTIVQMSDIHSGLFMTEARMSQYVRLANSLKPDLIALTGDFVSTKREQVPPFINAISALKAKYGVFGCLGNHDEYALGEKLLAQGFARAGFQLLRNKNRLIDVNGAKLNVIGVDYIGISSSGERLKAALAGVNLDGTTILLCHTPYPFEQAAKMGIHLMLAGHTHGGQISLTLGDMILTPARLATAYLAGLFRIGDTHLYVNRGLGTSGPPIRINAPPEITHITLRVG